MPYMLPPPGFGFNPTTRLSVSASEAAATAVYGHSSGTGNIPARTHSRSERQLALLKATAREAAVDGDFSRYDRAERELLAIEKVERARYERDFLMMRGPERERPQTDVSDSRGTAVVDVEETVGLTEFSCACHPLSSIAFPCPNAYTPFSDPILNPSALVTHSVYSPQQIGVTENERISRMSLNRIWEQPHPAPAQMDQRAYGFSTYPEFTPPGPNAMGSSAAPYFPVDPAYANTAWPQVPAAPMVPRAAPLAPSSFDPFGHIDFHSANAAYHAPAVETRYNQHQPDYGYASTASSMDTATVEAMRNLTLNEALATWYAEQVVMVLVRPGMFRAGVNGQSDAIWNAAARERDSYERTGGHLPDFAEFWSSPVTSVYGHSRRSSAVRDPSREAYDPWNVMWKNELALSERLVRFIYDLIQRMSIGPPAIVAAVWYLHGLGLHDGDGEKGKAIRALLKKVYSSDDEAVERRVALLGLLLAGKWLDDNSFLTKSWTEVTRVPIEDVDQLERAALADLYFSLHIPLSSWADHVNKRWSELLTPSERSDDTYTVLLPILDEMVAAARVEELSPPVVPPCPDEIPYYDLIDERIEAAYYAEEEEMEQREYEAESEADQVDHHDVDDVSEEDSSPVSQYYSPRAVDTELEVAARNVNALVDDDMDAEEIDQEDEDEDGDEESEDESEDEYLDYDGAARFLPSMAELRRSASNSSAQSDAAVEQWRRTVREASASSGIFPAPVSAAVTGHPFAFAPPSSAAQSSPQFSIASTAPTAPTAPVAPVAQSTGAYPIPHFFYKDEWNPHSRNNSSTLRREPQDPRGARHRPAASVTRSSAKIPQFPLTNFKETGVFLEPGIAQVRPPTGSSMYHRQPLVPLPIAANGSSTLPMSIFPNTTTMMPPQGGGGGGGAGGQEAYDYKGWASSSLRVDIPRW